MATAMMEQYLAIKQQYQDCLLFFRLGDFYEMFFEDAQRASKALDLILTKRGEVPMCGVPQHTLQNHLAKLINMGFKVAICEQLTEAIPGQMVERGVVRVVTPGTVTDENILDNTKNNYIMSVFVNKGQAFVCYCDITTGEFCLQSFCENVENCLTDCLSRILPKEIVGNNDSKELVSKLPISSTGIIPQVSLYYDWAFSKHRASANLKKQFGDNFEKVFELEKDDNAVIAGGALLEYLNETQKRQLNNINKIQVIKNQDFLTVDYNSRRNLELAESNRERKKYGSLLWVLDKTNTSMGARRLKKFFDEPLRNSSKINERLKIVELFFNKIVLRNSLQEVLSAVNDIERIAGKIAYGNILPKELISLKKSLNAVPQIKGLLENDNNFKPFLDQIADFSSLTQLLDRCISAEPPSLLKDGGYIADGFHSQLDELRDIANGGDKFKQDFQVLEREKTGIANLKVDHNRVIGFYIEVNKRDVEKVPVYYIRKQTISNNERYITQQLEAKSQEVLVAKEKANKLEAQLYSALKDSLFDWVEQLQKAADVVGYLDCLLSLAIVAVKNNFVKPTINNSVKHIKIEDGRHPVVEQFLKNNAFIANDTFLNSQDDRIMIITGPNMAGKSTYMRQVAIIAFMAHIGSFVPCKSAEISICDRIFTRVGASDDLAFGQSTFMVEMSEVATILASATKDSLIILDEIGRGTSTFDGLSIAWAVVEHISKTLKSKTLFATHYHELTALEGVLDGAKNFKVSVKEMENSVIFLHKILRGGANKSFGIEVAKLAQVPFGVIERAKEISKNLERLNQKLDIDVFKQDETKAINQNKKAIEVLSIIKDLDINRISPMSAFDILADLICKSKEDNNED